jgi:hypothetical protein
MPDDDVSDLPHVVGLGGRTARLKVQDLLDALAGKDVVVATDPFHKAESG